MSEKKTMWGGRFSGQTEQLVQEYTESVSFDKALYAEDIAGSKAHATMLAAQGVISKDEAERLCVIPIDDCVSDSLKCHQEPRLFDALPLRRPSGLR